MTDQQQAIILLMKSAVTGQAYTLPEDFDLEQALPLIKKHHMITLIYAGALNCGISQGAPAMQKMFPLYLRLLLKSERQQDAVEKLHCAFCEANIDHMLLKGSRLKNLYPKPELRYMGDADILIRMEQYDRIRPVMESLGYQEGNITDHELHWDSNALNLELHRRLIPSSYKAWFSYYGDGWKLAEPAESSEYRMRPEDEWIFLFTHFAKHYRNAGVGCRYVVDMWIWRQTYPNMDEEYIRQIMDTLQLRRFYDNMLRLIDCWFHDGPCDKVLDVIAEYIFSSGSWGTDKVRAVAQTVQDAQYSASRNGRLFYLIRTAFPPVDMLKYRYPVLQNHPWMLPLVWIHRFFYKLLFKRSAFNRQIRNASNLSQENLRLREEMLQLVGLDYHF